MNGIDRLRLALRRLLRAPVGLVLQSLEPRFASRARHQLAICAIFREEARFLEEWISFHLGVGVTHFYLYNNFSTDNFRDVLAPWIDRGIVTLTDWPRPVGQLSAYRHCLKRARRECRWLAFIDIDEFLFSPGTTDIRPVLAGYAERPGLEVWELFFGSDGHRARPALSVTEAYRKRAPLTRHSAKTICNPRLVYKLGVHQCKYWLGQALDTARRPIGPGREPVLDRLRINHYWSRSIEDLETKIARNDASTAQTRSADWHFAFEKTLNAEFDDAILPIVRRIRAGAGAGGASPRARSDQIESI